MKLPEELEKLLDQIGFEKTDSFDHINADAHMHNKYVIYFKNKTYHFLDEGYKYKLWFYV